jgi:hypothetical protein
MPPPGDDLYNVFLADRSEAVIVYVCVSGSLQEVAYYPERRASKANGSGLPNRMQQDLAALAGVAKQ